MDLNCYKKKKLPPRYTEMFRDKEVWEELEQLLAIDSQKYYQRKIDKNFNEFSTSNLKIFRAWSAGCASGEEAYSLVQILQKLFRDKQVYWKVYATDILISPQNIVDSNIFEKDKIFIKNKIRWKIHNLVNDQSLPTMNLILCRNVLMFFTKEYQEIILDKLYKSLRLGAYLVLGKTESLRGSSLKKLKVIDKRLKIFQKI